MNSLCVEDIEFTTRNLYKEETGEIAGSSAGMEWNGQVSNDIFGMPDNVINKNFILIKSTFEHWHNKIRMPFAFDSYSLAMSYIYLFTFRSL